MQPTIFLEIKAGPAGVLELACKSGWWGMSRTTVVRFAHLNKDVRIDNGSSLFATLLDATTAILKCTEESHGVRAASDCE